MRAAAITRMGVMIGPKRGGKHGYVEETVRERVSREEMTKGWQGTTQGGIDQKQNSGKIVDSSL